MASIDCSTTDTFPCSKKIVFVTVAPPTTLGVMVREITFWVDMLGSLKGFCYNSWFEELFKESSGSQTKASTSCRPTEEIWDGRQAYLHQDTWTCLGEGECGGYSFLADQCNRSQENYSTIWGGKYLRKYGVIAEKQWKRKSESLNREKKSRFLEEACRITESSVENTGFLNMGVTDWPVSSE